MEYLANEMKKYTRSNQDAMKQKMGEINEKKKEQEHQYKLSIPNWRERNRKKQRTDL